MEKTDKVWGLVLDFNNQKDANKFISDYDKQWFIFDNEQDRENLWVKFIHEACTQYGECEVCRFSSTGKTEEELEKWIMKTFINYK